MTPSQQFLDLIKSLNGRRLWETRCSEAGGDRFTIECWIVPPPEGRFEADSRLVIVQRWRDGNCTVFRQSSMSHDLKVGLEQLRNFLTAPDGSKEFAEWDVPNPEAARHGSSHGN